MRKITIRAVIIKSKVLKTGEHRVRLSVAPNNETRYILTDVVIPSEKNFKQGEVVGLPNASILNRKIRRKIEELYTIGESLMGIEYISCSQLVDVLENGGYTKPTMMREIVNEFFEVSHSKQSTQSAYRNHFDIFLRFVGEDFNLSHLTPQIVNRFVKDCQKKKLSSSYLHTHITSLKTLVRFATTKRKYFSYHIDPFVDYQAPPKTSRNVALSVEQFRLVRDMTLKGTQDKARLYFLLSFYMCGMNPCDLVKMDFSAERVKFKRQKNETRIGADKWTEFSIQPEAKDIANRIGRLTHTKSIISLCSKQLKNINSQIPGCRLILYSARKTFAQLATELGIADSVIEYCIGDQLSIKNIIDYYRQVSPEMADAAIRRVFDFVASEQSLKEYKAEHNLL